MIKKTTTAFLFMALLTCFILLGGTTAKADDLPDCKVVKTCTCTVDGVVRTLTVYENTYIYMQQQKKLRNQVMILMYVILI